MNFFDVFAGIKNPNYVVQKIETEEERSRIPAEHLERRRKQEFHNLLVDEITRSGKFKIESEHDPFDIGDPRNVRYRAEVFVLTRDEIHRLVQNTSTYSQHEILSFISKLQADTATDTH